MPSNELSALAELETRLRQAEVLAESYKASAAIHSMRADAFSSELNQMRGTLNAWNGSKIGRVGRLVRLMWFFVHGKLPADNKATLVFRRSKEIVRTRGARFFFRFVIIRLQDARRRLRQQREQARATQNTSVTGVSRGDSSVLVSEATQFTPKLLIIAEVTLPQCAKYRVWQKKEELEYLGWSVQVVDWYDETAALTALQTCTEVIFYRTPAFDSVKRMVAEARRLGLSPWWEVDDLIFDPDDYRKNGNLGSLSYAEQADLLYGARLFRECMLSCDRGIASTRHLAKAMRRAGLRHVQVIENALDVQTLAVAQQIQSDSIKGGAEKDDAVLVVYGSGTRTHDADFRVCVKGLVAAMDAEPRLRLCVVGELNLPEELRRLADRVEALPGRDYPAYMALLAKADISIAPLEATYFNDAKSNIKFLEASILRVASICSPRDAFIQAIRSGKNAVLANNDTEWRDAFLNLARDAVLRRSLADAAYDDVMAHYRPEAVAVEQVAECFPSPAAPPASGLRVMAVNIYFAPRSFGGATVIAEEMACRLNSADTVVAVFTAGHMEQGQRLGARRETALGLPVVETPLPVHFDSVGGLDNPRATRQFIEWIDAFRPDVVHFHSIQGLGLGLLNACIERNLPYVITLHDAWWLCERQFMVTGEGRYCAQTRIDLRVCQNCVRGARHLELRETMMKRGLEQAAMLLSPSEAHRALYIANGVSPDRIKVNRNGFFWPGRSRPARPPGSPLRFGYVGGVEAVKGYPLIREAFEALDSADWELVLIDNKLNLGFSSIVADDWKVHGTLTVRGAYNRDTMDEFYAGIDVLLFPSQWMESYGLTVREALSRDVWVVVTAPGGQAEDVTDGVNGTLIPLNGTSTSLQTAVEGLLHDKGRFDHYVNPLKDRLATFEAQAQELETILKDVAGAHRSQM